MPDTSSTTPPPAAAAPAAAAPAAATPGRWRRTRAYFGAAGKLTKYGAIATGVVGLGALVASFFNKKSALHERVAPQDMTPQDPLAAVQTELATYGPADGRPAQYWQQTVRPGAAQNVAAQPEMNVVDPATVQNLGTGPTRA